MADFSWIKFALLLIPVFADSGLNVDYSLVGEDAILSCGNGGDDEANCGSTSWTHGVEPLFKNGRLHGKAMDKSDRLSVTENCSLLINEVTTEDGGQYTCTQTTSGQTRFSQVYMTVVTITERMDRRRVTLTCSVSASGFCGHTVNWLKDSDISWTPSRAECRESVTFPTSSLQQIQNYPHSFKCKVTDIYSHEVRLFTFPSAQTTAMVPTTTTTTTRAPTTTTTARAPTTTTTTRAPTTTTRAPTTTTTTRAPMTTTTTRAPMTTTTTRAPMTTTTTRAPVTTTTRAPMTTTTRAPMTTTTTTRAPVTTTTTTRAPVTTTTTTRAPTTTTTTAVKEFSARNTGTKQHGWLWFIIAFACLALILMILLVFIRCRRMKDKKNQCDENTADPVHGINYTAISSTKKTKSKTLILGEDDNDEDNNDTYDNDDLNEHIAMSSTFGKTA